MAGISESSRRKVLSGMAWKFSERISGQVVSFILQIVLARLLLPEQYGMIAMVNVFIVLANVFVVNGFSSALIQNKEATHLDFSTIFWCSLAVSILLYSIIHICAPLIEEFYNIPGLASITRVYGLSLVLCSYNSIQQAYVSRHMMFKKFFYSTLIGTIVSGFIGILMAYHGYGVWSLVAQYLSNIVINIIVLQFIIDWSPRFEFSFSRAKSMMKYGVNILGASLLGRVFDELRQLLIGKYYTSADLAFYNRGRSLPHLVSINIESTIDQVLFPAMSDHSDRPEEIKRRTRRSIRISSYVMYFFMTLLALAAKPIILLLLTDKWAESIPYMQIMCVSGMITVMSSANMQAIKALGRSDVLLKLEFIKKPLFLIFLVVAVRYSVMAVALSMPLYAAFAAIVNMSPNKKLLNYSISEQLKDQLPAILLSLLMALCIYPLLYLPVKSEFVIMLAQCVVGTLVYIAASLLFKVEQYKYIIDMVKSYTKR